MNIRVLKKSKSLRDKESKSQRGRRGIRTIRSFNYGEFATIRVLKYSFSFCGFCVKHKFLPILRILREANPILRETQYFFVYLPAAKCKKKDDRRQTIHTRT